jgi:hypothetical protein
MAELKTKKTTNSVDAFLQKVDVARRDDCVTLVRLMKAATKADPKMWGASIVGFGEYHYKYASGREGDWFQMGFSPRKNDLTLYIMPAVDEYRDHLAELGPHKTGVGCLYIKRLADVDRSVLKKIVTEAARRMRARGR